MYPESGTWPLRSGHHFGTYLCILLCMLIRAVLIPLEPRDSTMPPTEHASTPPNTMVLGTSKTGPICVPTLGPKTL